MRLVVLLVLVSLIALLAADNGGRFSRKNHGKSGIRTHRRDMHKGHQHSGHRHIGHRHSGRQHRGLQHRGDRHRGYKHIGDRFKGYRCSQRDPRCRNRGRGRKHNRLAYFSKIRVSDYTSIMFVFDGDYIVTTDSRDFIRHQKALGRSKEQTKCAAHEALDFFLESYGINCKNLLGKNVAKGGEYTCGPEYNGTVKILTSTVSSKTNYQATSFQRGKKFVSLHNAPISKGGWILTFDQDIDVNGTKFSGKIKAGEMIQYCEVMYPGLPGGPMILYSSAPIQKFSTGTSFVTIVQNVVEHSIYGKGTTTFQIVANGDKKRMGHHSVVFPRHRREPIYTAQDQFKFRKSNYKDTTRDYYNSTDTQLY